MVPHVAVKIMSRERCKSYKANTIGHSILNLFALVHPVAK